MKQIVRLLVLCSALNMYTAYAPTTIMHNSLISTKHTAGRLIAICGSMCSGKSHEIARIVEKFSMAHKLSPQEIAPQYKVQAYKSSIDDRILAQHDGIDPTQYITSRSGLSTQCLAVKDLQALAQHVYKHDINVIVIDEAHFFGAQTNEFLSMIKTFIEEGRTVIVSGLALDFRGEPFNPMPQILALADEVIKLTAICRICGQERFCISQRLINGQPAHYNDPLIMVGDNEYEPRCRACHIIRKD